LYAKPAIKIPQTPKEEEERIKNTPILISEKTDILCIGTTAQAKTAKVKVLTGAKTKIIELDALGIIVSLARSFIASAKACKEPNKPTTLGPRRR